MDDSIPQSDTSPKGASPASDDASVPLLSYATPSMKDGMVRLRRFSSQMDANLARLKLEAAGLQVQLAGEAQLAGIGQYGAVSGELELTVHAYDLETAKKILQAVDDRRAARHAAEEARLRCPNCHENDSRGFDTHRLGIGLFLLVVAITCLYLPTIQLIGVLALIVGVWMLVSAAIGRRTCRRCGNRWTPPPEAGDDDLEDEVEEAEKVDEEEEQQ